ncbi:CopG family ribbon-helix-helix protein [Desulfovibrio sp. OttesenSCG-928-F07]|nr:CopG family ribbon-helix-helix protein [Desulfovibrio sp. OttesenSCG-928-F07]
MTTVTARIDEETKKRLEELAQATERSRSWLISDAVKRYVQEESWQVASIKEAIHAADAGEFATEQEVFAAFAKWNVNAN